MRKKFLHTILFLNLIFIIQFLFATSVNAGTIAYTENSDGTLTAIPTDAEGENLVIPEVKYGKTVTKIGADSGHFGKLVTVTLPETIVEIEANAFNNCTTLTRINFPSSLKIVGESAFKGCTSLNNIIIPKSVECIRDYAFSECTSLKSITLPGTINSMGKYTFRACSQLSDLEISEGITTIENFCFSDCRSLKSVILPRTLKNINESSFEGCISLNNINIPEGVVFIGAKAFKTCTTLNSIDLPNALEYIGYRAFSDCTGLLSIAIPENVTSSESYIFDNCTSLKNVTLPSNMKKIPVGMFRNCISLKKINLPNDINSIEMEAFYNCGALTYINLPDGITVIGKYAFYSCDALFDITLPENLTKIEEKAFSECTNITTIKMPKKVTSIGKGAFGIGLKKVYFAEQSLEYVYPDSFHYGRNLTFYGYSKTNIKVIADQYDTNYIELIPISSIKIYGNDSVLEGKDKQLKLNIEPEDAYPLVKWTSSNPEIATVDENGYIKGIKEGMVQITVSSVDSDDVQDTFWVNVKLPVLSIEITGKTSLLKGETTQLSTIILPEEIENKEVVWSSSDSSVAAVNLKGTVIANEVGNTIITASAKDGSGVQSKIEINVEDEDSSSTGRIPSFIDVKETDWFFDAVEYCNSNGIITGYGNRIFAPYDDLTRGMLVTILYKMEKQPNVSGKMIFPDVSDTAYYYKAVLWASKNNIVSGYGSGNFGPDDKIIRQDLSVILCKYASYKGKDITKADNLQAFTDADLIDNYAMSQMKWAVASGVITGNKDKTLNPKGESTRAEVAAMIEKYCKKIGR